MMDWLFIYHDIKIWSTLGNYIGHKYVTKVKSVNFSPVISLTDNTEAISGYETLESNNASSAGESGS